LIIFINFPTFSINNYSVGFDQEIDHPESLFETISFLSFLNLTL